MTTHIHPDKKQAEDTFWLIIAVLAGLVAFLALLGLVTLLFRPPSPTGPIGHSVQETLDASQEPAQNFLPAIEPFAIEQPPFTWQLTPRASYQITARVLSIKQYTSDWMAPVSPVDLALAWGLLKDTTYDERLNWRHTSRWFMYSWAGEPPLPTLYIRDHSANVHLVPATENLTLALKQLKPNDILLLEGSLVDIERREEGSSELRGAVTSLTRQDQGNGGCEIMYVKRLVVAGTEYR